MIQSYLKHLNLALVLLLIPTLAQSAEPKFFWKKHPDYIATVHSDDDIKNNHPQSIPIDRFARILSQIRVKNSPYNPDQSLWNSEEKSLRLFTDREIDLLGTQFSQALGNLASSEKIIFSISDYRNSLIGKKRLSVSGSLFVRNNHLNILLGEVHVDLSARQLRSGITGNYGRMKNELSTGDIKKVTQNEWELVPFEGALKVKNRKDWITIDLARDYTFAHSDEKTSEPNSKYMTHIQKKISNESLDTRISKLENMSLSTGDDHDIELRLRRLKKLYENGALPESIYHEKIRSIMQDL